ncbi:hypothetical protein GFL51_35740, partial [Rhizobium leguminosarum bv. viciae]|nr:hypothetical protein [Rhizobium leguminosarum bv. viciae]
MARLPRHLSRQEWHASCFAWRWAEQTCSAEARECPQKSDEFSGIENRPVDGQEQMTTYSIVLGAVEVQGFFWGLFVIQAADGTICADGRPMGENGTTLPRQAV